MRFMSRRNSVRAWIVALFVWFFAGCALFFLIDEVPAAIVYAVVAAVLTALLLYFAAHGDFVRASVEDGVLRVDAPFVGEEVRLKDAVSLELRRGMDVGSRIYGAGFVRKVSGTFGNREFGRYTVAGSTDAAWIVVKKGDGKVLAFNLCADAPTEALYADMVRERER